MDDLAGCAVVGVIVLAVVLAIVKAIVWLFVALYKCVILLALNGLTAADRMFGGWCETNPIISWVFVGFLLFALGRFAFFEANKLSRPEGRTIALLLMGLLLVAGVFAGPPVSQLVASTGLIPGTQETQPAVAEATPSPAATPTPARRLIMVLADKGLNIREARSAGARRLGGAARGDVVEVVEDIFDTSAQPPGQWYGIRTGDNLTGYIFAGRDGSWVQEVGDGP